MAGFTRGNFEHLTFNNGKLGFQKGVVEPNQNVARGHCIAIAHMDRAHHAAIRVLDHLLVNLDLHGALRDDGPGDLGAHAPGAKTTDQ